MNTFCIAAFSHRFAHEEGMISSPASPHSHLLTPVNRICSLTLDQGWRKGPAQRLGFLAISIRYAVVSLLVVAVYMTYAAWLKILVFKLCGIT